MVTIGAQKMGHQHIEAIRGKFSQSRGLEGQKGFKKYPFYTFNNDFGYYGSFWPTLANWV